MKQSIATIVAVGLLAAFGIMTFTKQTPKSEFDFDAFGRIPVVLNGRVKPLDTVARNALTSFSGKSALKHEDGSRHKAIEWFAELALGIGGAEDRRVFRIYDEGIRNYLPENDTEAPSSAISALLTGKGSGQFYYSFRQLLTQAEKIQTDAQQAAQLEAGDRSIYQRAVLDLASNMMSFRSISLSIHHGKSESYTEELDMLETLMPSALEAMQKQQKGEEFDKEAFNALMSISSVYREFDQFAPYFTIPVAEGSNGEITWEKPSNALSEVLNTGKAGPVTRQYARIVDAYRQGQPEAFNAAVQDLLATVAAVSDVSAEAVSKAKTEQIFNYLAPFFVAKVGYIIVLLLALFSWMPFFANWGLNRAAYATAVCCLVIHTIGIAFRVHIIGYAPVINLYSSAIFVGWVAVVLSLILERMFPRGIGNFVAAIIGFSTLMLAPYLGGEGDSLEMMRAVLDSNFWLTTHVLTITMGYGSTFLAGFIAAVFIIMGLFTTQVDKDMQKACKSMVYGIVCFSTLFSFIGTILGGIWADQSWGRFWGWDPKENGAILLVLWNTIILHARWGGFIRTRGLMVMAVFGNVVTAWSWMGTNMLGVGLHSYGFMSSAFAVLVGFDLAMLAIMLLALVPNHKWRSPISV